MPIVRMLRRFEGEIPGGWDFNEKDVRFVRAYDQHLIDAG